MANPQRGEVTLVAGTQRYTLQLTTNACCELEDLRGKPWLSILTSGQRGALSAVRDILWASLRTHHPEFTRDDIGMQSVGALMDRIGTKRAHETVTRLLTLNADEGEAEEATVRPPEAQPVGIGADSTATH